MFTVYLKIGAEIYQVKLSGSKFKRKWVFMSCVIRGGPLCHRMVVKVKNKKALKEIGEIQRTVARGWSAEALWKQPLSWGAPEARAVHQTLWIHWPTLKILDLIFPWKVTLESCCCSWECQCVRGLFNCVRSRRHLTVYLLGSPDCMRAG